MVSNRVFYVTVSLLSALIIAMGAGILVWADNHSLPDAILTAGSTFTGAVMLFLLVVGALGLLDRTESDRQL